MSLMHMHAGPEVTKNDTVSDLFWLKIIQDNTVEEFWPFGTTYV
jgi:hypothetical protein